MKIALLLPVFFLFAIADSSSQYYTNQNKIWAFGSHGGVNFSTGSPVFFTTSITTSEGCASVSSAAGSLLFYTDGHNVYNSSGGIMTGGTAIVPYITSSTSQATLIIPVLGSPNQYYLFSLESLGGSGRLDYCIVDMSLSAGAGAVVSATLATPLATDMSEKMIAVAGNSCDIWLVTHRQDSAVFLAYDITTAGISAPVVSSVGTFTMGTKPYSIGMIKATPDRSKIVCQAYTTAVGTELYDFNPSTGIVSGCRVLDAATSQYGAEFSPDNTKLYVGQFSAGTIAQYDVSLTTTAAIIASKAIVGTRSSPGDLKLAPDNKIYVTGYGVSYLDCISNPNAPGTLCGYISHADTLSPGSSCNFGLPNLFVSVTALDTTYAVFDTAVCIPAGDSIIISAHDTGFSYLWNDSITVTRTRTITAAGNYWVQVFQGCHIMVDTIHVTGADTLRTSKDTAACIAGDFSGVTLTSPAGSNYLWYDGDTAGTNAVGTSGSYWVEYRNGCIYTIDTFNITLNTVPPPFSGPDTICIGDTAQLFDSPGGRWQTSATAISVIDSSTGAIVGLAPGTSVITFTLASGCSSTKTITIISGLCNTGIDGKVINYRPVEIYPNPATSELTVTAQSPINQITITNLIGQTVLTQLYNSKQVQVDVAGLPSGVYFVKVNGNEVRKFVKE